MQRQRELFSDITLRMKAGQSREALSVLRRALQAGNFDAQGIDKAGRLCPVLFTEASEPILARVLLLGQCTTTWLGNALTAVGWGHGTALRVVEGGYDNVLQELMAASASSAAPDIVVLLPWSQRLFSKAGARPASERIEDECAFWRQVWALIGERLAARIIQVGYDVVSPGAQGYSLGGKPEGALAAIRQLNERLMTSLPRGAAFLDLEQVSGEMGRQRFYEPRRYHWTKQPFSEDGTVRLAEHISALVRATMTGPKKVLVLDLDNTLWGGVVGETGPLGIALGDGAEGEAFTAFQLHIKQLSERGIVLAVSSKNNEADAREPFEKNPNMILSLDDFARFEANWEPKAVAIRRMAKTLQLGLDSFVFFDDNPAEREHIRQALPDVAVVEVPDDPAEYVRALDASLWFEAVELTKEDQVRSEQYRSERRRNEAEVAFESLDAYLESLEMVADVRPIDDTDLDRVAQLLGKTNQFNVTTKRHSAARVRQLLAAPGAVGLTLRVADRFGDHGLVSVLIAAPDSEAQGALQIDTWLMSCRVISRTVEECLFNALVDQAQRLGYRALIGVYSPTPKNGLVQELYDRMGFVRRPAPAGCDVVYDYELHGSQPMKTYVRARQLATEGNIA